ncbi:hypothetical protein B0T16DRAFT_66892 [Cercophora newfieldiana]|uniref:Uncharacterized protein n=1 Tax=Cercophora newfieldiana TaxID=92897 RepID=A0AA39YS88_9PEZI|nr:hypothetical protein B0T16DRAFT_66892 [Cercophora newfieldiana]
MLFLSPVYRSLSKDHPSIHNSTLPISSQSRRIQKVPDAGYWAVYATLHHAASSIPIDEDMPRVSAARASEEGGNPRLGNEKGKKKEPFLLLYCCAGPSFSCPMKSWEALRVMSCRDSK